MKAARNKLEKEKLCTKGLVMKYMKKRKVESCVI